ncbi:DUF2326 domain-containing protein [Dichelobacter nodosus]|uniref:DUF2326 domain-containing protein n=1 Tax=Dichelobacter nodosus TaxID=870 RepID=UPI000681ACF8|nr:DUF2326 domain-containing protein [Dichelobacter nodosus]KNZ39499.1 hypothetical protein AKG33_03550 [Dichelobacter nodosus]
MKLSKLYSNLPDKFSPITFNDGVNFIYGDVKHPKDHKLDSHNLGKTTLARLLDFMFLAKKNKEQFLYKHIEIFERFIFFLEINLETDHYLTIRRSVAEGTKVSFITHKCPNQDYKNLANEQWDHIDLPFEKAKEYLDGVLNLTALKDWNYRQSISYLIRTQDDFGEVFQLNKYRGKDINWKPYLADLLGFDGNLAKQHYEVAKEEEAIKKQIREINNSDEKSVSEALSKIDGRLLLYEDELNKTQNFIESFNFHEIDKQTIERLVEEIDNQIIYLNKKEYTLKNSIQRIERSFTENKIKFDSNEVKKLFEEAQVLFPEQIIKNFEQLIAFNEEITRERNGYLKQELDEHKTELEKINEQLKQLNKQRSEQLQFLKENELFIKFKESNQQVVHIQAEILNLKQKKESIEQVLALQKQQRELKGTLDDIKNKMQANVTSVNGANDGIFANIRLYFNEVISKVLSKRGELSVFLNEADNLEFQAEYQDKTGKNTSESKGGSYQKLLCIAFDLAVTRAYLGQKFPQFIYIDGVFDSLDDRKKELLLEVLREYGKMGIQIIATTINTEAKGLPLIESEITLKLHDDGQSGRLFKMDIF